MNKQTKIITAVLIVIVLILAAYATYTAFYKGKSVSTQAELYTCPMHPQVISDHPGQCPICAMDLVKKSSITEYQADTMTSNINEVRLSPNQQVLANVQTEKVTTKQFSGEKTFNGYIRLNEKSFAHISTPVSGKIINMYVNFEGQYVSKGQAVMEIYSPEMVSTQKEYLLALDNLAQVQRSNNQFAIEQAEGLVNASRTRLQYWEFTERQFSELERTKTANYSMKVYAKYGGIVTKRYVHPGHWATAGEDIYDVADLSTVWVMANIYEGDIQYIKQGQFVDITSGSYPEEIFRARINFIDPLFNADTRTLSVRIEVANPGNKLKPDMYVKIMTNTFMTQTIAVPKNAVIRTGERNIVYIEKEKGVYVPREIMIGFEQDGYYAVTGGLGEGEKVVTSGGFLIDSESQIRAGMTSGNKMENMNMEKDIKINPDQDIMKDMDKK